MRKDPPVRDDGLCAHCLGERRMPKRIRYTLRAVYEAEPFCSTECAREHHHAPLSPSQAGHLGHRGMIAGRA